MQLPPFEETACPVDSAGVCLFINEAIQTFLKEGGYSAATVSMHGRYLGYFRDYAGEIDIASVSIQTITKFESYLRNELKKTPWTIYEALISMKALFKFLFYRWEVDCIDPAKIIIVRPPCGSYSNIPTEQIARLLKSFDQTKIHDLRNYCIVLTFYSTGCRASELFNLKISQIDWSLGEASIIGAKTGKPRKIYFTSKCLRALKKYLAKRDDDCDSLFIRHAPPQYKTKITPGPITAKWLRCYMPQWGHALGIKRLHPHALRKSCATDLYNSSNDLLRVQKIMGHSRPETTSNYAIVDNLKDFHTKHMGQNHRIYCCKKTGGAIKWELEGWVAEGGNVKKIERAISKAIDEATS
jgi:site-specific recombinase XerD